jgi:hypothetical protein
VKPEQLQIILDIWPPDSWITGARYRSQPATNDTLSACYVHGSGFTVNEYVHNWYLRSHL